MAAGRNKNERAQPPDLPLQDGAGAEAQQSCAHGIATFTEHVEQIDQHVADDDVAHQAGDPQAGVPGAETIQPLLHGTQ